ncbi:acylphosphatase [Variovorax sp. J22R133]|uniref:acylphosphatase n=1 Tax=Variovorax brevis TaxID=3053503 RepID=UPI0025782D9F|nr:acylphosphatase [Variovorax sp. J22R133]MDM0115861.1 acylphosphatase [Variovorax sp. J22R133]
MDLRDATAPVECELVRVRGRVQGVGYRDGCAEGARALGVSGWVRNRADGSVEALLQGTPQQLADMREWMSTGVHGARVDSMDVTPVPAPFDRLQRFERRPTV